MKVGHGVTELDINIAPHGPCKLKCDHDGRRGFAVASRSQVHELMTCRAQRNQVQVRIVPRVTSECSMVYLQIPRGTAFLTSPTVAREHLESELFVCLR